MAEIATDAHTNTQMAWADRRLWLWVLLYSVAVIALYHDTAWSIVSIWNRTETFAHGYLIVPIALWLAWGKRSILASLSIQPNLWVLALMVPTGSVWLLAYMVNVQVVQQLAMVAILVLGIWAIVGNAVASVLAFPLGFLFLGVPMGEDLVPSMMELTATSTVWLVQLTGIPVYREGLFFSLPSGNWSVVDACSGVRYLIASFTLGVMYAYLTYRSLSRRLLFVLASIVVPVIANLLRAYGIVMLGHLSGMTIATGVDHLLYGWVFFGLVMFLLFWLGSLWREDPVTDERQVASSLSRQNLTTSRVNPVPAMLLVVAAAAVWPLLTVAMEKLATPLAGVELPVPVAQGTWTQLEEAHWAWKPADRGADQEIARFYRDGDRVVALYIQQYLQQKQGAELVDSRRYFHVDPKLWRIATQNSVTVAMGDDDERVIQAELNGSGRSLLVWSWYRIGDHHTANPYAAKLLEIWGKLTFGRPDSARIVLAADAGEGQEPGSILQSFLSAHLPEIEASLDRAIQDNSP